MTMQATDKAAWSREAEATLLGALVSDGSLAIDVFEIAAPNDFLVFGGLARLISSMSDERVEIDYLTVKARANGHTKDLDEVTNWYEVNNCFGTPTLARQWASEIRKNARRVELDKRLIECQHRLNSDPDLSRAERYISDNLLASNVGDERGRLVSIHDIATANVGKFAERFENPGATWGVPTGFKPLDKYLGGFVDKNLYLIAARPSVGKTSLMLAIANNIASAPNALPVAMFSLEMSAEQALTRLTCMRGRFNSYTVRQGLINGKQWTDDQRARFFDEYERVGDLPLWIDESCETSVQETRNRLAILCREHQPRILFFDYINLAEGRGENRNHEISGIMKGLKGIAKEFQIPVVALAQLSRKTEARDEKRPTLPDLRDSGSLEEYAQGVLFLYREDYVNRSNQNYRPNGLCEVIIAKNTDGAVGTATLRFDEALTRFEDV